MEKAYGLNILHAALDSQLATRMSIAKALGIHPSQVSRIAAGKFERMDGHALRVCKYALSMQATRSVIEPTSPLAADLFQKAMQIASISPAAAKALTEMLAAMIEQWSPNQMG